MGRRSILLAFIAVPLLLFGITFFTHQGVLGEVGDKFYLKVDSTSWKATPIAANSKYASMDHCPYYPPRASHIPSLLSESTLLQCQDAKKRFLTGKPILLVIVNSNHFYLLANWLCVSAAHIDTQNLLVVVPPEESDFVQILRRKGINAVQANYREECLKQNMKKMDQFHRALLIRNLMIMLLTDWGYDVAVFDPDAFILQDPMEMYQKIAEETHAHVIGQRGKMPLKLKGLWGFTLCAGAMYYRSSTPLNDLWQAIAEIHIQAGLGVASDDQKLLNNALHKLGIQWRNAPLPESNSHFGSHIGTAGDLTVVVVATNYSTRASMSDFEALDHEIVRIVHAKLGRFGKNKAIQKFEDSLWKLSMADFNITTTFLTGSNKRTMKLSTWLKQICMQ